MHLQCLCFTLLTIVYLAPKIWDLEKVLFFAIGNHQKVLFFHENYLWNAWFWDPHHQVGARLSHNTIV